MKNNMLPSLNFYQWHKDIVDSKSDKYKIPAQRVEASVISQFQRYTQNRGCWNNVQSEIINSSNAAKSLIHCFDRPTRKMNELRGAIKRAQPRLIRGTCQYCQINEPDTLDHFLEKSQYQEFSIYGENLIPCCTNCNRKRPSNVLGNSGQEVINFYFDTLPNERYLFCDFIIGGNGEVEVEYKLDNSSNIVPHALFNTIENHYGNLNLLSRYSTKCTDDLADVLSKFRDRRIQTQVISTELNDEGIRFAENRSVNHWKVALYLSAAQDQNLITFLHNL